MLLGAAAWALLLLQTPDFGAEGLKALEAQKYEEAAALFGKAIASDPADFTAHFHLALANTFLQRDAEAIAAYRKTLDLKPGLYQAQLNLGMVLLRQKQAQEAIPLLSAAVEQKPAEFRPRFYLAEALLAAGEAARAEEHYRAAAQADPKSAAAELGLGRVAARTKRLAEAAGHFHKAAELDPSFRDALLELAAIYEKDGRTTEAIRIYQQFPDNVAAQERLGELLVESKQFAEAIPRLEEAVKKDPTPANRLALATAYHLNGQGDKAIPLLEALAAADASNYDLHMLFGRVLRDRKQYMAAAREFHQSVKLRPNVPEPWKELAGMLFAVEQYPQTIAALDQARKLGDTSAGNLYFRAVALDRLRQYPLALEAYNEFLKNSEGKNPEEEFIARQRVRVIRKEMDKR
jgi:tetratricopeptide (TPR) repeat protein